MMVAKQIPFQLKSITTREFATVNEKYNESDEIGVSSRFKFGMNQENHTIIVLLDLAFEWNEAPLVILKITMEFDVMEEAFRKFKSNKAKAMVIPKDFLTHLAAMTVGTARGILHARLENTDFNHLLLPALNVSDVIREDVEFEL